MKVYGNCQTATLLLNGKKIGTQQPDRDMYASNVRHPPFTFQVDGFQAGELEATGFINGKPVASYKVKTFLKPHRLRLTVADDGRRPKVGKKDVLFVYAAVVDENGRFVPTATNTVRFKIRSPGCLIGHNPIDAEAGIASILVETTGEEGTVDVGAQSPVLSTVGKLAINVTF